VPSRARRQFILFKENAILPSGFRQMVQGAYADRPAANDHDASVLNHIRIPPQATQQQRRRKRAALTMTPAAPSGEDSQSEKPHGTNYHVLAERLGRDPFRPRGGGVSFLVVKPDGLWKSRSGWRGN
jgi:hypothetical protein